MRTPRSASPNPIVKAVRAILAIGLATSYFSFVFRVRDGDFWRAGLGDWIDPYFINALLEHWYNAVRHFTSPLSPPMFFPVHGTLGYSHGLVLYAPFYVLVRPFLHPFLAYNVALLLVVIAGSVSLYALLRKWFGLGVLESGLLSAFFATSGNVINGGTGAWAQRLSVYLLPPILLVLMAALEMRQGWRQRMVGAFAGLLFALLLTQDPYTGEFAVLLGGLALAWWVVIEYEPIADVIRRASTAVAVSMKLPEPVSRPSYAWAIAAAVLGLWAAFIAVHPIVRTAIGPWRYSAQNPTTPARLAAIIAIFFIVRRWQLLARARRVVLLLSRIARDDGDHTTQSWAPRVRLAAAIGVGAALGLLLFLYVYIGSYAEHRGFPIDQLMNSLYPRPREEWHGWFDLETLFGGFDDARSFQLAALVAVLSVLPWSRLDRRGKLWSGWLLAAAVVTIAVALRFGDVSIWRVTFGWIPGLGIIRDPKRISYVYELAAVLAVAALVRRTPAGSFFRRVVIAVVLLLLVINWNTRRFDFDRPIETFDRWVQSPMAIDPACRSFFVRGASDVYMSRSGHQWSLYAVDAMFIAMNHSIPTLNGYSAWGPDGWGLANPQEDGYRESLDGWIAKHSLRDVCELDIESRTMRPYAP